jgi:hypothetical protein
MPIRPFTLVRRGAGGINPDFVPEKPQALSEVFIAHEAAFGTKPTYKSGVMESAQECIADVSQSDVWWVESFESAIEHFKNPRSPRARRGKSSRRLLRGERFQNSAFAYRCRSAIRPALASSSVKTT